MNNNNRLFCELAIAFECKKTAFVQICTRVILFFHAFKAPPIATAFITLDCSFCIKTVSILMFKRLDDGFIECFMSDNEKVVCRHV